MKILTTKASIRNPFLIHNLPFAAKIYRLRKGKFKKLSLAGKVFKKLIPGKPFLAWLLKFFPIGRYGSFDYQAATNNINIKFNIRNTQFHSVYFPQYKISYEPETTVLIDLILNQNPDGVFFDVGANWGHMSLHAASSKLFKGEIHSFEPFLTSYQDLSQIVEQSGKKSMIETHHLAVSDVDGVCYIGLPDNFNSGNAEVSTQNTGDGQKVESQKIDSMNFKAPDLIKIDVEGFEINVLMGARETLKKSKPMIIFENWADLNKVKDTLAPFKYLRELGYHFFEPSFLIDEEKDHSEGSYFAGYSHIQTLNESCHDSGKELPFSLIEFIPEQRFLLKDQLNVFACHGDKLEFLDQHFKQFQA
jgi:FkbM family methyltransferase